MSSMYACFSTPIPCSPRQHPAGGERRRDDLRSGRVHPLDDAWLPIIEQQQRMQVAVAGMEDVHDDQLVTRRDLIDLLEHVGQLDRGTTVSWR